MISLTLPTHLTGSPTFINFSSSDRRESTTLLAALPSAKCLPVCAPRGSCDRVALAAKPAQDRDLVSPLHAACRDRCRGLRPLRALPSSSNRGSLAAPLDRLRWLSLHPRRSHARNAARRDRDIWLSGDLRAWPAVR